MKRSHSLVVATAAAAALALAAPTSASAAPTPSDPIATGLAGPLQFDVGEHGIYVGQDFAGVLTKVRPNGTTKDLAFEDGEISGVAANGYDVAYLFTGADPDNPEALLRLRRANGTVRTIANLQRFEERNNPDGFAEYGFRNLTPACAAQVPPEVGGEPYTGIVESHPYALANAPGGGWYVADAAANDILYVTSKGKISVVHVPRPQKSSITAEVAELYGLPDCAIGKTYAFEPVPTDVEVNKLGYLIVSLLPGGPEDASLGARGAVLRISPGDFEWGVIARGFLGATNVAVAPGGTIYVSELFAGRISVFNVREHVVTPYADVLDPAGLEYVDGTLYASTDVFGAGNIVTINP